MTGPVVHREAAIHFKRGREILLIGHSHHPEVVGTLGQLPEGAVTLIETAEDAKTFVPKDPDNLAFVTQTTLSIDDTAEIVALLKQRFPNVNGPHKEDICYATTNRQEAVKEVAPRVDALIVVGSSNSSNSQRLREANALDFDDLIHKTLDLLQRVGAGWVLYKLDRGVDHVLIDEAQDTNPQQWEILRRITEDFCAGEGAREADASSTSSTMRATDCSTASTCSGSPRVSKLTCA